MNILMLTPRFPYPATRGDCIRTWGELRHLSQRHRVWLACVDHHAPQPEHLERVRSHCAGVVVVVRSTFSALAHGGLRLLGGGSLAEGYFADRRLARQVRDWAERVPFDAVLIFSPEMAQYAERLSAARRVLDMNDVESFKWRVYARQTVPPWRWLYAWESRRLAAAERRWCRTHDVCLLVNSRERRKLEQAAQPRVSATVRTGVDPARYEAVASSPLPREPVVGFIGSMSYPPNVRAVNWFGQEVWPRVKRAVPAARWLIVGNHPRRSVRQWARRPGVTVTGFVADVRPYLAGMRVFACPVAEEIGVQTKLIEALAAARPAVVTPAAAGGIDYDGRPPFLIAATPDEFAAAVLKLLDDEALAQELRTQARAVAGQNYRAAEQYALVERWLAGDSFSSQQRGATSAVPFTPEACSVEVSS